jgi:PAS domain S-box-containing protein
MPEGQVWAVLLIDDDEDDYILTRDIISLIHGQKCYLEWAPSFEAGRRMLADGTYDAILVDDNLGAHTGLQLIRQAVERGYPSPFILLTGQGSHDADIEAMQAGVTLSLTKDEASPLLLERSIRFAIQHKQSELEQARLVEDLKAAMLAAQNSRSQMEAIFAAQNDIVLIYDTAMRVQQVNQAFPATYGFNPVGMHINEIIRRVNCRWLDGRVFRLEDQPTPRALQGERVAGASFLVTRADGTEGAVATSSGPIRNGEQITGSVTVWHDISELAQAQLALRAREAQLQESEQRFRVALSNEQMIVFTMNRDLRYTWMYYPRQGNNIDIFIGKRDDEIGLIQNVDEVIALKQAVIDSGQPAQKEMKILTGNQVSYYIITLDPIFDASGQVNGLTGAALDITRLYLLEAERAERATQVEVQRRLTRYREQERQEIARNLHDGPIQTLIGTIFTLQVAKETSTEPAVFQDLEQVALSLKNAIGELRDVVNELRPPALLRFGLSKAIQTHAAVLRDKNPDVRLSFDFPEEEDPLSEAASLTLFRIYQEGINNILRHAHATHVRMRITRTPGQASLEIRDNGQGFAMPTSIADYARKGHYGLAGMLERAEAIGGTLEIQSSPGQGTHIQVTIPVLEV